MLIRRGDLDEAEQVLRVLADAGNADAAAAYRLAEVLVQRGDLDEAAQMRRALDAGPFIRVFPEPVCEDLDELRARADAGDEGAAFTLVRRLGRDDLDELRARADAGDFPASCRLAELLTELLTEQGRGEEADRLRRYGFNPDGSIASR